MNAQAASNLKDNTLRNLRTIRREFDHELGAVHELIRDHMAKQAAFRLRGLAEKLEREARMIESTADELNTAPAA